MAIGPIDVPDDLRRALADRAARLDPIGSRIVYFETTSSTNDVADRLAADGAAHGTVVCADAQESGRGRLGRTWFSPMGAGLYVSVVLRPENLSNPPAGLAFASAVSLTAGVALAEGIRAACGLEVAIKWPNDLVIERRKLCGILAEATSRSGELQHVILGYGINLRPAAYPADVAHRASSLESELGREVDRAVVLAETLASLSEWLERTRLEPGATPASRGARATPVPSGARATPAPARVLGVCAPSALSQGRGFAAMLNRWRQLSPSAAGTAVEVLRPGGAWCGATTAGIDNDGALLVTIGGTTERVIAGEVRWI